jgi:hypothetical protein
MSGRFGMRGPFGWNGSTGAGVNWFGGMGASKRVGVREEESPGGTVGKGTWE